MDTEKCIEAEIQWVFGYLAGCRELRFAIDCHLAHAKDEEKPGLSLLIPYLDKVIVQARDRLKSLL